ncbi:efflux RND transporter permease subunit [Persicirhabdus sediminis]|uniref:Multidrug efflux RND transporter permease subunit n=1 Tax=Persicirhabdus sediminis TaxID=454144 RepID=A0A8J7SIW1_9BACT|nr:multidrug efflux RND transporter permease subunit [Persicirhabdus sediminis]MBK1789820.1 multidrug efflux RND transporter permease subunit [Persicirhabdus sediminis]
MFTHTFINRPVLAMVISIVIIIMGGVAMLDLPIERYPTIAPPSVTVSASYPGADAQTVSDTVAGPLEEQINGVEHMLYMRSVCGNDGSLNITITFAPGTDLDMANVMTQNRVSAAMSNLPQEVQRMGVKTDKQSQDTNLFIALFSPDQSKDGLFLSNYMKLNLKDEIARVNGVGKVNTYGTGDYSMRLWLDPDRLHARRLTSADVINAVSNQSVQVAGGKIGEPPARAGQMYEYTVNLKGRLVNAQEFGDIVVKTGDDGRVVRVRDVADVELGSENYGFTSTFMGQESATMAVYQIPGANAIEVSEGVSAKLEELKKRFPQGVDYKIAYDNTDIIKASMNEVVVTLFATLILVVITVFVFLQNFRATLVPSASIPVSLIGTFAVMAAIGFTINQFTLFGLVLVIGIVVDDAIVVVENVTRHLQQDKTISSKEATKRAMNEITGPVIATTLVLLSVFVPVAFMPGITGTLFQQFAITISVATIFSSINALTLSPALCGMLLKRVDEDKLAKPFKLFNSGLDKTINVYSGLTRAVMRKAALGLLLFVGMTALALYGFSGLPSGFVPQEDEGYCMINIQLPDGSSQERTVDFIGQVNDIIAGTEGVDNYLSVTGYSLLDGVAASNSGFAIAVFKDWSERPPEQHQNVLIQKMNAQFAQLQEGLCMSFPVPSLPGVGLTGGFTAMVQDTGGAGIGSLAQVADGFVEEGNTQTGLAGVNSTFRANVPQLYVDIDRDQVLTRGLSLASVFEAMQNFLGSAYINDFVYMNRNFKVKAQARSDARAQPVDINHLEIRADDGKMVPLGAVASVENSYGPQQITRFNMYPSVTVRGGAAPGFSSGQAMAIVENMAAEKLPNFASLAWTDLSYQEKQASGSTTVIFMLAIVLVYLILAAQYESWSVPVSVCMSVPTALLGAVLAVIARGMDNNVYTQVGVVLLIGLATKSAILIVEFAKEKYEAGASPFDAALDALKLRFRAVLMTAFSFILGVLPLLVATGAGSESRKVLGTVVFGGMCAATALSLIVVPMLYYILQALIDKLKGGHINERKAAE